MSGDIFEKHLGTYWATAREGSIQNHSSSNSACLLTLPNGKKKNFQNRMRFTQVREPTDRRTDRQTDGQTDGHFFFTDLASLDNHNRFPLTQGVQFDVLQTYA